MVPFKEIFDISLIGVGDPSVPNNERVVLRASAQINPSSFALGVGVRSSDPNKIFPLNNHIFWFPNRTIQASEWILVYTATGEEQITTMIGTDQPVHVFHWGLASTIFNHANIIPVIYRFEGMLLGPNQGNKKLLPIPPLHSPTSYYDIKNYQLPAPTEQ